MSANNLQYQDPNVATVVEVGEGVTPDHLEAEALYAATQEAKKQKAAGDDAVPAPTTPKFGIMYHFKRGLASAKNMTAGQILGMAVCVLLSVIGMSGQLILLNMWVGSFPEALNVNVPFTILTLSASTNALCYGIGFLVWVLVKRVNVRFIFTKKSQLYGFGVGWSIALNGVFIVSATAGTPEVIQAFLLSTGILWTFLFVKVLFGEKRSYNNPLIYVSFILSLGGIVVGSASKFAGGNAMDANTLAWTGLFAFGMIPGAVNGVVASKYMRYFTLSSEELARHEAHKAGRLASPMISGDDEPALALEGADANTAKFAMLAVGNVWQMITMFLMLPVGAVPWFGSSANMTSLGSTLVNGWKCTVGAAPGCSSSWLYFAGFNLLFVLATVGNTFLNYYSPAMTSMISQLSSPVTALILIIVPAWNVTGSTINIPESIAAVILITVGSLCYTAWEESTRHADIVRAKSERSRSRLASGLSRRSIAACSEDGEGLPAITANAYGACKE